MACVAAIEGMRDINFERRAHMEDKELSAVAALGRQGPTHELSFAHGGPAVHLELRFSDA